MIAKIFKTLFGISSESSPVMVKDSLEINERNAFGAAKGKETVYSNGYKSRIGKRYPTNQRDERFEDYYDNKGTRISKETFKQKIG